MAALITAIVGALTFYFAVYLPYINAQDKPTDTTPPVIRVPSDITEEATSPDGAAVRFEEVSADDGIDGAVDVSCDHESGETFPIGDTIVTCTSDDSAGNPAEKRFTITVQDTPSGNQTTGIGGQLEEFFGGGSNQTTGIGGQLEEFFGGGSNQTSSIPS